MIKRMMTNNRMSQIVVHGNTVYLAGQIADNAAEDVQAQTRQVLTKIECLLDEAGTNKDNILSASIWLKDMSNFGAMNEVWDAWLPEGAAPARACVESNLAFEELEVEIGVIAAINE